LNEFSQDILTYVLTFLTEIALIDVGGRPTAIITGSEKGE
jgi:hypothetical protein